MFGIVLWSASDNGKAVVWCEDQGDLAFFNAETEGKSALDLDFVQGDLLQFDIAEDRHIRVVRNARRIAQNHSPFLARRLKELALKPQSLSEPQPPHQPCMRKGDTVVPFPLQVAPAGQALHALRRQS